MRTGQRVKIKKYPYIVLDNSNNVDGLPLRKYWGLTMRGDKVPGTVIGKGRTKVIECSDDKGNTWTTKFTSQCRVQWDNGYFNSFSFRELKAI